MPIDPVSPKRSGMGANIFVGGDTMRPVPKGLWCGVTSIVRGSCRPDAILLLHIVVAYFILSGMGNRLKSKLTAQAILRFYDSRGLSAYLRHKGDEEAGDLMIVIGLSDGRAVLYSPSHDMEGRRRWTRISGDDPIPADQAEVRIAKARSIDPDLWVIEIEERQDRALFLEIL